MGEGYPGKIGKQHWRGVGVGRLPSQDWKTTLAMDTATNKCTVYFQSGV